MSSEEWKETDIDFVSSRLHASADKDLIFLEAQRMLLVDIARMGFLRRELISTLGMKRAKGVLKRMGYASGERDLVCARKIMPDASDSDLLAFGPNLHRVRGGAYPHMIKAEVDVQAGHFYCELVWDRSYEADIHFELYGLHTEAVCWEGSGYATGYTSALMGKLVYVREVSCRGKGDAECRIVGKPAEEWVNLDIDELDCFKPDPVTDKLYELQRDIENLRDNVSEIDPASDLLGESQPFKAALNLMHRVQDTEVTVLLLGETGVGKECFARYLHEHSSRRDGPFVAVNCGAIPEDLLEAELFGVQKGAFTGAITSRAGRFERASGGTLFLDEVGELSASAQTKLLRVLQESEYERVGGGITEKANARIIAATNVDLATAVQDGRFRMDLMYRINVYPITIPPLRDRSNDIVLLSHRFIDYYSAKYSKRIVGVDADAVNILTRYSWPGNVRELQNMIERGVILASNNGPIQRQHLVIPDIIPDSLTQARKEPQLPKPVESEHAGGFTSLLDEMLKKRTTMEDLQSLLIVSAVEKAGGNLSDAAKYLGLSRAQVSYSLKRKQAGH